MLTRWGFPFCCEAGREMVGRATAGFAGRRGGGSPTRGPGAAGGWAHFHVPFAIRYALGYAFRRGGDVAICNLNEDSRHLTAPERTVECRVSESSVTPTTDFATTYVNISSYSLFHITHASMYVSDVCTAGHSASAASRPARVLVLLRSSPWSVHAGSRD